MIKSYCKEFAQECSDLPFGAEERRKQIGDELIRRGITEIKSDMFIDPFKVCGSEFAREEDPDRYLHQLMRHWGSSRQ